jgi:YfiH family protein
MTMTSTSLRSSSSTRHFRLGRADVRWTGRQEGDLGITADSEVSARRALVHSGPWAWAHQVHGRAVLTVDAPGSVAGAEGDALVTARPGVALAVFTADCAPVAFSSPEGVVGVAHAGWRGVVAGVLEATADTMRGLGATTIEAALGPCIRPDCYEFGDDDLARLEDLLGPAVRGRTVGGRPALDLPAAVGAALDRAGVALVADQGGCTACSDEWFSFRARRDAARQATLVVAG